jgi:RecA/RadA recombinase
MKDNGKQQPAHIPAPIISRLLRRSAARGWSHGAPFTTVEGAPTSITYWFSTTIPPLDVALSGKVGTGFPAGRAVELYGEEQVGKTTLGCTTLAAAQTAGALAVMMDTEGTFTESRAQALGLRTNELVYAQDYCLEHVLEKAGLLIRECGHKTPCLLFWDTVAGTPSLREDSHLVGESALSVHARILSEWFRREVGRLSVSRVCLLFCNQLKEGGIGRMFATERDHEATLGGRAMRFHTQLRLRMKAARKFSLPFHGKETTVGDEVRAMVVKDKDRASNVRGRDCVLVLMKIGEDAGRFSAPFSSLRTLQSWGALPAGHTVKFLKRSYTLAQWAASYREDEGFRRRVHLALEAVHAGLLRAAVAPTVLSDGNEEEDL